MKCVFCGNDLTNSHETVERRIKSKLYYVKNVPADLCKFCGEVYIDDEVVTNINKMLEKEKPNELNSTEVIDFRELSLLADNYPIPPNKKLAMI